MWFAGVNNTNHGEANLSVNDFACFQVDKKISEVLNGYLNLEILCIGVDTDTSLEGKGLLFPGTFGWLGHETLLYY